METYDSTARPAGVPATWKDKQGGAFAFRAAWHYRDGAGVPVGIVARFDGDAGKQVRAARLNPCCMARNG